MTPRPACPGDRGGGFKFRPEGYTSSSAKVAEDATLLLEGDSSGSAGSSFGVVNAGHTHGYGSWGRAINAYPAKKWILNGGHVYQTCVGSTDVSWRADGTEATQPVCIPNGAATLCVSNGFNYVKLSQNGDANSPTNSPRVRGPRARGRRRPPRPVGPALQFLPELRLARPRRPRRLPRPRHRRHGPGHRPAWRRKRPDQLPGGHGPDRPVDRRPRPGRQQPLLPRRG